MQGNCLDTGSGKQVNNSLVAHYLPQVSATPKTNGPDVEFPGKSPPDFRVFFSSAREEKTWVFIWWIGEKEINAGINSQIGRSFPARK